MRHPKRLIVSFHVRCAMAVPRHSIRPRGPMWPRHDIAGLRCLTRGTRADIRKTFPTLERIYRSAAWGASDTSGGFGTCGIAGATSGFDYLGYRFHLLGRACLGTPRTRAGSLDLEDTCRLARGGRRTHSEYSSISYPLDPSASRACRSRARLARCAGRDSLRQKRMTAPVSAVRNCRSACFALASQAASR